MLQSVDGTGGSLQTLLNKIMIYLVALSLILCSAAFAFREYWLYESSHDVASSFFCLVEFEHFTNQS
jgi:hypothetical protein